MESNTVRLDNSSLPYLYFQARGTTYQGAVSKCQSEFNGSLLVLKDRALAQRIANFFPEKFANYYRIGLRKAAWQDFFSWTDGSVFNPTTSGLEEPTQSDNSPGCQTMNIFKTRANTLRLREIPCYREMPYICEYHPSTLDPTPPTHGIRHGLAVAIALAVIMTLALAVGFLVSVYMRRKEKQRSLETPEKRPSQVPMAKEWEKETSKEPKTFVLPRVARQSGYTADDYVSVDALAPPGRHNSSLNNPLYGSEVFIYSMAEDVPETPVYSQVKKKRFDSCPSLLAIR